jgi:hypothetical protein
MELYPKRKSDEEYVNATRRLVRRSRWFGLLHVGGALFFLVMFQLLWNLICSSEGLMGDLSPGVRVGITLGAMGGVFLLFAVQNIIWAAQYLKGLRTEKLMLAFHDELTRTKEASNKASEATSGSAPGAPPEAPQG